MLSPRWRKILRDLQGNKARTALVVLSIAVGVFAMGVIVASQMILATVLPDNYGDTLPAHAMLFTRADDALIESVRRIPGVAAAEGRASIGARVLAANEEWREISLVVAPDYSEMTVSRVMPVAGAVEPREKELLLERTSIDVLGIEIGDRVQIELPNNEQRTLTVSGVVHDLSIPSALFNPTLQGYVSPAAQEWLTGARGYSSIEIRITQPDPTEAEIRAVVETVEHKIEKGGQPVSGISVPPPGEHWADEILQPLLMILVVLGVLTLLLSGFLVVNTISAILAQQVRQIGVMKTIGAQTGQLTQMYLATVLVFGALSLLISIPLGAYATYAFVNFVAEMLNFFTIPFQLPPAALALQVGVGLLVPLLAAIAPVFSAARLTVLQALSNYGMGSGAFGKNWLDHLLEQVRGLPRPILLSLRNTFRRKARLLLTLSTLVLGGAIFIAVLTVHSSLMSTLDDALAYWNYDLDVFFTRPYRVEQILGTASTIPGVEMAESWGSTRVRRVRPDGSESGNLRLLAPPAQTQMITPRLLQGRWLLPDDENAIVVNSITLDDEPDIAPGDTLRLKFGERESDWRVVGIVQGVMTGPTLYVNYDYFTRENRAVGLASRVQVVLSRGSGSQQQMAAEIQARLEAAGMDVASTQTTDSIRENVEIQFNILVTFLTIMALLIAVVGALGLAGTMSINVLERSREVGVMRAIGASDQSVLNIFLTEGMLIGFISWLFGALLSIPISRALSDMVGIAFVDAPLTYTFSLAGAGLWLVLVLILAALSSWWPSWRASRLTVRDVLAYE